MSGSKDSKNNTSIVEEQLFEILAKRTRENISLIIVEHKDEFMEKKYNKYQQAYVLFMVVPQQLHYVSKLTTRSKVGFTTSIVQDDELADGKKVRNRNYSNSMNYSSISPSKEEKEKIPQDSMSFSMVNQVRLNFFEQIVVWAPPCKDVGLTASMKKWLESIINGIQTLSNLCKYILMQRRQ
jgi:hypothetical protein